MPTRQGSFRIFSFNGIQVFLHWSWFLWAVYETRGGVARYSSNTWNVLEFLALFLIVLMHEFGHALACRQVGGYQQSQGVNPELFELWIGPDAAILTDKQAAPAPVTCA